MKKFAEIGTPLTREEQRTYTGGGPIEYATCCAVSYAQCMSQIDDSTGCWVNASFSCASEMLPS